MKIEIVQHVFSDNVAKDLVVIDLHGYTLYEVKTDLPYLITAHFEQGYKNFKIIHGFQSGQTLKHYCRTGLISKLKNNLNTVSKIRNYSENRGDMFLIIDI